MEKINIAPFISDLLFDHDCVIIADFGGFVANYKPSFLHQAQHAIWPPSKKIAFNSSLKMNDGLLANYIAENNSLTYQEACKMISRFVEETLQVLETGKKIHIPEVGALYYNTEKKIQFSPDFTTNYLLDSFGLSTVHSPAIKRDVAVKIIPEPVSEKETVVNFKATGKKRLGWRWVELIPAAAVLTLLFLNPVVLKNLTGNVASLIPELVSSNPFHTKAYPEVPIAENTGSLDSDSITESAVIENSSDSLPSENKPMVEVLPTDKVTGENQTVESNVAPPEEIEPTPDVKSETNSSVPDAALNRANSSPLFYLVAGCFKIEENAIKLNHDLVAQGYSSQLLGKYKGLHVVTFQTATTRDEAKTVLTNLAEKGREAWVLKK